MNFDAAMEARVEQERIAREKKDNEALEADKQQLSLLFGQFDRLLSNEDFQWWLNTVVRERIKKSHDAALDTKKTAEDRNGPAHQYAALNGLLADLEGEYLRLKNKLESMK